MSDEFYVRAQLVQNRVERLVGEARQCSDTGRLEEIKAEVQLCTDSLHAIREEQLVAMLSQSLPLKRRRWWQR